MDRARDTHGPSLLASALLHVAVLAAALIYWPKTSKPLTIGNVVPVGIVAEGPQDLRPALFSPEPVPAATPDPSPDAPIPPAAPDRASVPSPAPLAATPSAKTAAQKPKASAAAPGLDLDALAHALTGGGGASGGQKSSAAMGPARAETAVQARPTIGAGAGLTASAMADLASPLERLWNPNCEVEGGANVDLVVAATLAASGYLVGAPEVTQGLTADPITQAAAARAVSAFRRAEPFHVPPDFRQQRISFRFNARTACAHR
jgi:hypothetical protein